MFLKYLLIPKQTKVCWCLVCLVHVGQSCTSFLFHSYFVVIQIQCFCSDEFWQGPLAAELGDLLNEANK